MGLSPSRALTNVVLVATAFIWYYLAYSILKQLIVTLQATDETLLVLGINVTCIAIAAIISSLAADRLGRREKFLTLWMFLGILLALMPLSGVPSTLIGLMIVSVVFGAYFGLGMPIVMGFFSQSTGYENRAKLGGIIFLAIGFGSFLIDSLVIPDITLASVALSIIQIVGLLVFIKFKRNNALSSDVKNVAYFNVLSSRSLLLFLVPWSIFNIVNYMTVPVISGLSQGEQLVYDFASFENIIIAIFALVTGFLADSIGRKRLAIFGFAAFGVGYAALGLIQDSSRWYIHTIADGIAWGTLHVLFLFTLWGDLARDQKSEKFYVIGSLPFVFTNFITLILKPLTSGIPPEALFSFASFFLFLAVLPLFYAPETLPEKVMKDRDLQSYVEKAKQKAQKEAEKSQKRSSDKTEKEETEETPEDEEARKLAEKYY